MSNTPSHPSFAELDALLDEALALDEPARVAFLARLSPDNRQRVLELLELSEALTLSQVQPSMAAIDDAAQLPTIATPSHAGRWRLQHELGTGGMGQVFYATRQESDGERGGYTQRAAIKVLWSHRTESEVQARFFRERRILAALDHPGLARFLDGGFLTDGRPWFAMEYVDGVSVTDYSTALPLVERLQLFTQVCATVAYAHERLIVHRDIKPQNVLVDRNGRPKLLDFGVASVLDGVDDDVHTRTQGGPLTLRYASPEQVTGNIVTVASDVYQLGLLLYELITAQLPYSLQDQSLQQALSQIVEALPVAPSSLNREIEPDLDAIVLVALSKRPQERYQSATALAEDIARYLNRQPVLAVPHSRWYVARRFLRRNALIVSAAAVTLTALSAATFISLKMANEAQAQAQRSATSQQILTDVFQQTDPFGPAGAKVTLADALVQAKPGIDAKVADDPLLAWEVNRSLAGIYENLGLVEHEIDAYQAVIRAAEQIDADNRRHYLLGIAGLGNALARTNPSAAVSYFDENLPIGPDSAQEASSWLAAQYAYVGANARLRNYQAADQGTQQMARVIDQFDVSNPRTLGRLSQLLAGVARRSSDSVAEGQHWLDAVAHMRAADKPAALAVTLSNRALYLGRSGQFDASGDAFREAVDIFEQVDHADDSLAGVLRSYAGLQFRMGDADAAIATTQRAMDILGPDAQPYARYIAALNLARYHFVIGDVEQALELVTEALPVALKMFDAQSGVPQRMSGLLAKLLLFAGETGLAATSINVDRESCAEPDDLYTKLDQLEDPAEQQTRKRIWTVLKRLANPPSGAVRRANLEESIRLLNAEAPAFFDVLDRWRAYEQLAQAVTPDGLPESVRATHQALSVTQRQANQLVATMDRPAIAALVASIPQPTEKTWYCD
ncbi:MAG: protein kinase domain-containing protein [Pseudomonadales bacterium]